MRHIKLILLLIGLCAGLGKAQYGNEWINFSQSYYSFPIVSDGVYRIERQALIDAGIDLTFVDPRGFQVFGRGQEIKIYVEGEGDGSFDSGDYIEFYAQKNDGYFDAQMYDSPDDMVNPYFSLVTDTIQYYLTWNSESNNERYTVSNSTVTSGLTPVSYVWDEKVVFYNTFYHRGEKSSLNLEKPGYKLGEGFVSTRKAKGDLYSETFSLDAYLGGGLQATFKTTLDGQSNDDALIGDHFNTISLNGQELIDTVFEGTTMMTGETSFTSTLLNASNTLSYQSDPNSAANRDYWAIGYWKLEYPMNPNFNFTKKKFAMDDNPSNTKSLLRFNNYTGTLANLLLYDLTNGLKIIPFTSGSNIQAIIPDAGNRKNLWMQTASSVTSVGTLTPVTFQDFSGDNKDYIIITADLFSEGANNYAAYRTTTGYDVGVYMGSQIYHQFGHGIDKHPHAIRNFLAYVLDNWTAEPEYLFFIGDGIVETGEVDSKPLTFRLNGDPTHFIPSYGSPGSDVLFSAGLGSAAGYKPAIATGRLAVVTNQQVNDYLSKVVEHEGLERAEWMKRVIHFSGGGDLSENQLYTGYLNQQKAIIEDTLFGGNVYTYRKYDTSPIAVALSDSLKHFIEDGTRILNVFAHAAATNFEYFIEDPDVYDNEGKYYFIVGVSCRIGDTFKSGESGSEKYVQPAGNGAIGFLSTSSSGLPSFGNTFTKEFYRNISVNHYNDGVGKAIQSAIGTIQTQNDLMRLTCLTMILNGDPAIALSNNDKPDYTIYKDQTLISPDIFTTPGIVTTEVDSFDLNLVITNIGLARDTSFWVSVTRDYANDLKADTTYSLFVDSLYYKDTLRLRVPVDFINGIGINNFSVHLDNLDDVDEMDNTLNNMANYEVFIRSADLIPVYPYEYSVIPDSVTKLIASTGDLFAPARNYVFQIDTSDSFTSPELLSITINQSGGVISWDPQQDPALLNFYMNNYADSVVYFWRTSIDSSLNNGEYNWRYSSFQFISGKEGWGQAHFHQRKKDTYTFINYRYNSWTYDFVNTPLPFRIQIARYFPNFEKGYLMNGSIVNSGVLGGNSAGWNYVGAINNKTLEPIKAEDYEVGQFNSLSNGNIYNNVSDKVFHFKNSDASHVNGMHELMINQVPDSFYLFLYTYKTNYMPNWTSWGVSDTVFDDYADLGMDTSYMKNGPNVPSAFFVKKGDLSTAHHMIADDVLDTLIMDKELAKSWTDGSISSTLIGPSTKWNSVHWRSSWMETPNLTETFRLEVWGVPLVGPEVLLLDSAVFDEDVLDLESYADATIYPYLRLKCFTEDLDQKTPTFLDRWHVLHDEVPEAALNPNIEMALPTGITQEGVDYVFTYTVENISQVDMDSLQVAYWIIDAENNIHNTNYVILDSLRVGEFITDTIAISTLNLSGINQFWIEVNPYQGIRPWQLEKYHFNNIANWTFEVESDKINPVLDVTFDGVHILDGDIVSPQPRIVIQLQDENQFLALDDTSLFEIYMDYPHVLSLTPNRVYFSTNTNPENIKFYPATLPENKARLEFSGNFPVDGTHTLYLRGRDKSSNISGDGDGVYDYKINFEVVNESSISSILNYPNPFSTSTRFVFTLTGSKIPTEFKIQIMTITGKVVKEIMRDEIGEIHIGRNITQYAWDGKDQYGQQLANGVYLYRVITNIDGESIELYETNADQYFKEGFGKLYLMR